VDLSMEGFAGLLQVQNGTVQITWHKGRLRNEVAQFDLIDLDGIELHDSWNGSWLFFRSGQAQAPSMLQSGNDPSVFWVSRGDRAKLHTLHQELVADWERARSSRLSVVKQWLSMTPETVALSDQSRGFSVLAGYTLGEVKRQPDSEIESLTSGVLRHSLAFQARFAGTITRDEGYFGGRIGRPVIFAPTDRLQGSMAGNLAGSSTADLASSGVMRQVLTGEALVMVLERLSAQGLPEVCRVIVPSERTCRGMLETGLAALSDLHRVSPHDSEAIRRRLDAVLRLEITHVSDLLSAVARSPQRSEVSISAVGIDVEPHVLLGGAITIGTGGEWHQLAPLMPIRAFDAAVADFR
jgi:hypothetical protein